MYAKVYYSQHNTVYRVNLPFIIGCDATCHILLNLAPLRNLQKMVYHVEDNLFVQDKSRGTSCTAQQFYKQTGLKITGPFPGDAHKQNPVIQELFLAETKFWQKHLPKLSQYLGIGLPILYRYFFWLLTILVSLVFFDTTTTYLAHFFQKKDTNLKEFKLEYAQTNHYQIGATDEDQRLISGFMIHYPIPQEEQNKDHVFIIEGLYLDKDKEIRVIYNDKIIYEYRLRIACLTQACPVYINIPAELTKQPTLTLQIHHEQQGGAYLLRQFVLKSKQQAQATDLASTQLQMASIRRLVNESELDHQNSVMAYELAHELVLSSHKLIYPHEILAQIYLLRDQTFDALQKKRQQMWFEYQKNLRLENYSQALDLLKQLKTLYTDLENDELQKINYLIANLHHRNSQ